MNNGLMCVLESSPNPLDPPDVREAQLTNALRTAHGRTRWAETCKPGRTGLTTILTQSYASYLSKWQCRTCYAMCCFHLVSIATSWTQPIQTTRGTSAWSMSARSNTNTICSYHGVLIRIAIHISMHISSSSLTRPD